jgi:hypothetical protein
LRCALSAAATCSTSGSGWGSSTRRYNRTNLRSTPFEAHPDVYARMLKLRCGEKKSVRIVFGRWQDVMLQLGSYDAIIKIWNWIRCGLCFIAVKMIL